MATSLRVEIENATGQGLQAVKQSLGGVANAADKLGDQMNEAGKVSSRALDDIRDEANDARKALQNTAKAADGLGSKGKSVNGLSLQFTGMNQALEIGKKAIEGTTLAIVSLADAGNPAAQSLIDSFGGLHSELIKIGDDPVIVNTMKSWEGAIKTTVIPAIGQIPGALRWVQDGFAGIVAKTGEFTGFFPEGTTESLREEQQHLSEIADEQRAINEEARKTQLIFGRINDIENKLADESELSKIAQLKSERGLLDLLDLEIEARQDLADAGELSGKKLEASDKKVETIKRRLITLSQEQADAEIRAQTDVADARKKTADEYTQILADAKAVADEDNATKANELETKAKEAADELKATIAQAKSMLNPGKGLVDDLRGQFSGKDVQGQLVKQAKDDARQKYIRENRDKVDLEGKASGDTTAQRQANQRKADAAIAKAEREAVIKTTKQIRSGSITGEDELAARDSLLMNRADKANKAGLLKKDQRDALKSELDSSRAAFGEQQNKTRDQVQLESLRMDAPSQKMRDKMQDRRANMAGGQTQGTQDRAMGDLLGNVASGNQSYMGFAQTATQGIGQLANMYQQNDVRLNSLQDQINMILQVSVDQAARTRSQRAR